jgi:transcriptional antiterminator NusG
MSDTTGMKWYVLRSVSGKEGKVKEFIENAKKHNDVLDTHVG